MKQLTTKKNGRSKWIGITVMICVGCLANAYRGSGQQPVAVTINSDSGQQKISKYIYGHFSEDLGRCIYDGVWSDSALAVPPKKNRLRLDAYHLKH